MTAGSAPDAEVVTRFIQLAWNQGDRDAAERLLAADFRHHDLVTHAETDGSGYLGSILGLRRAFTSIEFGINEIFTTRGRVASRWTVMGTHQSGTSVEIEGLSVDHVTDGVIVENWTAWDLAGLQQQVPGLLRHEGSR